MAVFAPTPKAEGQHGGDREEWIARQTADRVANIRTQCLDNGRGRPSRARGLRSAAGERHESACPGADPPSGARDAVRGYRGIGHWQGPDGVS